MEKLLATNGWHLHAVCMCGGVRHKKYKNGQYKGWLIDTIPSKNIYFAFKGTKVMDSGGGGRLKTTLDNAKNN